MFFPISDDNPSNSSPLVTYFLIGFCLFVFFLQILSEMNPSIYYNFGFIPSNFFNSASFLEAFFPVITSMFVHGGFAHIIGNLLYLWIFGDNVEDSMGKLKFFIFYILCGTSGALLQGIVDPNTYYYELGENINELLNEAFNTQLLIATEQFEKIKENNIVKDVYDLITIASILEKESCPNERSLISGIIYNRLEKGMKLQIDSTVIYGIENFNGNLTKNDLRKSTPFNSYTNHGLPPKPISTPSKSSLIAAANPTHSEYLYFVSKGKCAHQFSKSYSEHVEAIKKYQLN